MTWGYEVFKATPTTDWQAHCTMNASGKKANEPGKCSKPAGYVTRYRYTTGRKGRASSNDRWVCFEHARKFAARHKCSILENEEAPRGFDCTCNSDVLGRCVVHPRSTEARK